MTLALILGCGYVGSAFGVAMRQRRVCVFGTCRTQERAEELKRLDIYPLLFEGDVSVSLSKVANVADIVLASAPPSDQGDPLLIALQENSLYTRDLGRRRDRWIGYLSTTGIYGNRGGGWAFEDDVATPHSVEAQRRVLAETQWRNLKRPAHVFRLPGIYGPRRSAIDQVKAGTARRIDKPGQVFSRAHRDDIVSAIIASIEKPNPGRAYNICDDLPCPSGDVIAHACNLLGVTPPPLIPFEAAGLSEMGKRFYSECKRVSNARAKAELGWRPAFPTYREGLANCLAR
jgi:nucleoside-diphosphate-sugar epimerase